MKKVIKYCVLVLVLAACFKQFIIQSNAAGGETRFGSVGYEWLVDEVSKIGVYMTSDEAISDMQMILIYDPELLEYRSGGELLENGKVRISGSDGTSEISEMLEFVPRVAGKTEVSIQDAYIENGVGNRTDVQSKTASVVIQVPDGCALNNILMNGNTIENFDTTVLSYDLQVENSVENAEIVADIVNSESQLEISDTELKVGINVIKITITNVQGAKAQYVLNITRKDVKAVNQEDDNMISEPSVIMEGNKSASTRNKILFTVFMVLLVGILIILIRVKLEMSRKNRKAMQEKERRAKEALKSRRRLHNLEEPEDFDTIEEFDLFSERKVEIAVENITMEFKQQKDEATSFKEFIIQAIKGKRSYERFKALDDICFTVKRGEVVGIIGTNGSGKSTLLKIISGALEPTKGSVKVDKKKVQLLTLGTGFDNELTGRENVYLNGAIIGYPKEFIDEKYDDIVEFAELEGFMEEKVRNYSTGMVARLGFAISTIRTIPEILILDEVLSVGDMFFRKKSEARIKKMIRGGATVLIVSHSPSVIRNNCTRAVWIEKGILKAVGDARDVCTAYEKMSR